MVRGVIAAVGALLGFGAGVAVMDSVHEDERRKMNEANEDLRRKLRSVLATFKANDQRMVDALADLAADPPDGVDALTARLRARGLTPVQVDKVVAALRDGGLYKTA